MRVRCLVLCLAVVGVMLAGCGASYCATVTLDAVAKSASSDSALLEPSKVKSSGEQVGVYIQSKSLQPQNVRVRIPGLKDGRYDVYVNWGAFRIKRDQELAKLSKRPADVKPPEIEPGYVIQGKSARQLAAGLSFAVPGRVVPAAWMRCVAAAQPKVKSAYDGMGDTVFGDIGRARHTLGLAVDWTRSAVGADEVYRSVQFFVAPAGADPKEMDWRSRFTTIGTKRSVATACSLLHDARVRMYASLADPLRGLVVEALTPVETSFRYSLQKGVPFVRTEVRNDIDLGVSGTVDVVVPNGWRAEPKQSSFANLKSGDVYAATFRLVPPSKGLAPPPSVAAAATIKVLKGEAFAKLRIARSVGLEDGAR